MTRSSASSSHFQQAPQRFRQEQNFPGYDPQRSLTDSANVLEGIFMMRARPNSPHDIHSKDSNHNNQQRNHHHHHHYQNFKHSNNQNRKASQSPGESMQAHRQPLLACANPFKAASEEHHHRNFDETSPTSRQTSRHDTADGTRQKPQRNHGGLLKVSAITAIVGKANRSGTCYNELDGPDSPTRVQSDLTLKSGNLPNSIHRSHKLLPAPSASSRSSDHAGNGVASTLTAAKPKRRRFVKRLKKLAQRVRHGNSNSSGNNNNNNSGSNMSQSGNQNQNQNDLHVQTKASPSPNQSFPLPRTPTCLSPSRKTRKELEAPFDEPPPLSPYNNNDQTPSTAPMSAFYDRYYHEAATDFDYADSDQNSIIAEDATSNDDGCSVSVASSMNTYHHDSPLRKTLFSDPQSAYNNTYTMPMTSSYEPTITYNTSYEEPLNTFNTESGIGGPKKDNVSDNDFDIAIVGLAQEFQSATSIEDYDDTSPEEITSPVPTANRLPPEQETKSKEEVVPAVEEICGKASKMTAPASSAINEQGKRETGRQQISEGGDGLRTIIHDNEVKAQGVQKIHQPKQHQEREDESCSLRTTKSDVTDTGKVWESSEAKARFIKIVGEEALEYDLEQHERELERQEEELKREIDIMQKVQEKQQQYQQGQQDDSSHTDNSYWSCQPGMVIGDGLALFARENNGLADASQSRSGKSSKKTNTTEDDASFVSGQQGTNQDTLSVYSMDDAYRSKSRFMSAGDRKSVLAVDRLRKELFRTLKAEPAAFQDQSFPGAEDEDDESGSSNECKTDSDGLHSSIEESGEDAHNVQEASYETSSSKERSFPKASDDSEVDLNITPQDFPKASEDSEVDLNITTQDDTVESEHNDGSEQNKKIVVAEASPIATIPISQENEITCPAESDKPAGSVKRLSTPSKDLDNESDSGVNAASIDSVVGANEKAAHETSADANNNGKYTKVISFAVEATSTTIGGVGKLDASNLDGYATDAAVNTSTEGGEADANEDATTVGGYTTDATGDGYATDAATICSRLDSAWDAQTVDSTAAVKEPASQYLSSVSRGRRRCQRRQIRKHEQKKIQDIRDQYLASTKSKTPPFTPPAKCSVSTPKKFGSAPAKVGSSESTRAGNLTEAQHSGDVSVSATPSSLQPVNDRAIAPSSVEKLRMMFERNNTTSNTPVKKAKDEGTIEKVKPWEARRSSNNPPQRKDVNSISVEDNATIFNQENLKPSRLFGTLKSSSCTSRIGIKHTPFDRRENAQPDTSDLVVSIKTETLSKAAIPVVSYELHAKTLQSESGQEDKRMTLDQTSEHISQDSSDASTYSPTMDSISASSSHPVLATCSPMKTPDQGGVQNSVSEIDRDRHQQNNLEFSPTRSDSNSESENQVISAEKEQWTPAELKSSSIDSAFGLNSLQASGATILRETNMPLLDHSQQNQQSLVNSFPLPDENNDFGFQGTAKDSVVHQSSISSTDEVDEQDNTGIEVLAVGDGFCTIDASATRNDVEIHDCSLVGSQTKSSALTDPVPLGASIHAVDALSSHVSKDQNVIERKDYDKSANLPEKQPRNDENIVSGNSATSSATTVLASAPSQFDFDELTAKSNGDYEGNQDCNKNRDIKSPLQSAVDTELGEDERNLVESQAANRELIAEPTGRGKRLVSETCQVPPTVDVPGPEIEVCDVECSFQATESLLDEMFGEIDDDSQTYLEMLDNSHLVSSGTADDLNAAIPASCESKQTNAMQAEQKVGAAGLDELEWDEILEDILAGIVDSSDYDEGSGNISTRARIRESNVYPATSPMENPASQGINGATVSPITKQVLNTDPESSCSEEESFPELVDSDASVGSHVGVPEMGGFAFSFDRESETDTSVDGNFKCADDKDIHAREQSEPKSFALKDSIQDEISVDTTSNQNSEPQANGSEGNVDNAYASDVLSNPAYPTEPSLLDESTTLQGATEKHLSCTSDETSSISNAMVDSCQKKDHYSYNFPDLSMIEPFDHSFPQQMSSSNLDFDNGDMPCCDVKIGEAAMLDRNRVLDGDISDENGSHCSDDLITHDLLGADTMKNHEIINEENGFISCQDGESNDVEGYVHSISEPQNLLPNTSIEITTTNALVELQSSAALSTPSHGCEDMQDNDFRVGMYDERTHDKNDTTKVFNDNSIQRPDSLLVDLQVHGAEVVTPTDYDFDTVLTQNCVPFDEASQDGNTGTVIAEFCVLAAVSPPPCTEDKSDSAGANVAIPRCCPTTGTGTEAATNKFSETEGGRAEVSSEIQSDAESEIFDTEEMTNGVIESQTLEMQQLPESGPNPELSSANSLDSNDEMLSQLLELPSLDAYDSQSDSASLPKGLEQSSGTATDAAAKSEDCNEDLKPMTNIEKMVAISDPSFSNKMSSSVSADEPRVLHVDGVGSTRRNSPAKNNVSFSTLVFENLHAGVYSDVTQVVRASEKVDTVSPHSLLECRQFEKFAEKVKNNKLEDTEESSPKRNHFISTSNPGVIGSASPKTILGVDKKAKLEASEKPHNVHANGTKANDDMVNEGNGQIFVSSGDGLSHAAQTEQFTSILPSEPPSIITDSCRDGVNDNPLARRSLSETDISVPNGKSAVFATAISTGTTVNLKEKHTLQIAETATVTLDDKTYQRFIDEVSSKLDSSGDFWHEDGRMFGVSQAEHEGPLAGSQSTFDIEEKSQSSNLSSEASAFSSRSCSDGMATLNHAAVALGAGTGDEVTLLDGVVSERYRSNKDFGVCSEKSEKSTVNDSEIQSDSRSPSAVAATTQSDIDCTEAIGNNSEEDNEKQRGDLMSREVLPTDTCFYEEDRAFPEPASVCSNSLVQSASDSTKADSMKRVNSDVDTDLKPHVDARDEAETEQPIKTTLVSFSEPAPLMVQRAHVDRDNAALENSPTSSATSLTFLLQPEIKEEVDTPSLEAPVLIERDNCFEKICSRPNHSHAAAKTQSFENGGERINNSGMKSKTNSVSSPLRDHRDTKEDFLLGTDFSSSKDFETTNDNEAPISLSGSLASVVSPSDVESIEQSIIHQEVDCSCDAKKDVNKNFFCKSSLLDDQDQVDYTVYATSNKIYSSFSFELASTDASTTRGPSNDEIRSADDDRNDLTLASARVAVSGVNNSNQEEGDNHEGRVDDNTSISAVGQRSDETAVQEPLMFLTGIVKQSDPEDCTSPDHSIISKHSKVQNKSLSWTSSELLPGDESIGEADDSTLGNASHGKADSSIDVRRQDAQTSPSGGNGSKRAKTCCFSSHTDTLFQQTDNLIFSAEETSIQPTSQAVLPNPRNLDRTDGEGSQGAPLDTPTHTDSDTKEDSSVETAADTVSSIHSADPTCNGRADAIQDPQATCDKSMITEDCGTPTLLSATISSAPDTCLEHANLAPGEPNDEPTNQVDPEYHGYMESTHNNAAQDISIDSSFLDASMSSEDCASRGVVPITAETLFKHAGLSLASPEEAEVDSRQADLASQGKDDSFIVSVVHDDSVDSCNHVASMATTDNASHDVVSSTADAVFRHADLSLAAPEEPRIESSETAVANQEKNGTSNYSTIEDDPSIQDASTPTSSSTSRGEVLSTSEPPYAQLLSLVPPDVPTVESACQENSLSHEKVNNPDDLASRDKVEAIRNDPKITEQYDASVLVSDPFDSFCQSPCISGVSQEEANGAKTFLSYDEVTSSHDRSQDLHQLSIYAREEKTSQSEVLSSTLSSASPKEPRAGASREADLPREGNEAGQDVQVCFSIRDDDSAITIGSCSRREGLGTAAKVSENANVSVFPNEDQEAAPASHISQPSQVQDDSADTDERQQAQLTSNNDVSNTRVDCFHQDDVPPANDCFLQNANVSFQSNNIEMEVESTSQGDVKNDPWIRDASASVDSLGTSTVHRMYSHDYFANPSFLDDSSIRSKIGPSYDGSQQDEASRHPVSHTLDQMSDSAGDTMEQITSAEKLVAASTLPESKLKPLKRSPYLQNLPDLSLQEDLAEKTPVLLANPLNMSKKTRPESSVQKNEQGFRDLAIFNSRTTPSSDSVQEQNGVDDTSDSTEKNIADSNLSRFEHELLRLKAKLSSQRVRSSSTGSHSKRANPQNNFTEEVKSEGGGTSNTLVGNNEKIRKMLVDASKSRRQEIRDKIEKSTRRYSSSASSTLRHSADEVDKPEIKDWGEATVGANDLIGRWEDRIVANKKWALVLESPRSEAKEEISPGDVSRILANESHMTSKSQDPPANLLLESPKERLPEGHLEIIRGEEYAPELSSTRYDIGAASSVPNLISNRNSDCSSETVTTSSFEAEIHNAVEESGTILSETTAPSPNENAGIGTSVPSDAPGREDLLDGGSPTSFRRRIANQPDVILRQLMGKANLLAQLGSVCISDRAYSAKVRIAIYEGLLDVNDASETPHIIYMKVASGMRSAAATQEEGRSPSCAVGHSQSSPAVATFADFESPQAAKHLQVEADVAIDDEFDADDGSESQSLSVMQSDTVSFTSTIKTEDTYILSVLRGKDQISSLATSAEDGTKQVRTRIDPDGTDSSTTSPPESPQSQTKSFKEQHHARRHDRVLGTIDEARSSDENKAISRGFPSFKISNDAGSLDLSSIHDVGSTLLPNPYRDQLLEQILLEDSISKAPSIPSLPGKVSRKAAAPALREKGDKTETPRTKASRGAIAPVVETVEESSQEASNAGKAGGSPTDVSAVTMFFVEDEFGTDVLQNRKLEKAKAAIASSSTSRAGVKANSEHFTQLHDQNTDSAETIDYMDNSILDGSTIASKETSGSNFTRSRSSLPIRLEQGDPASIEEPRDFKNPQAKKPNDVEATYQALMAATKMEDPLSAFQNLVNGMSSGLSAWPIPGIFDELPKLEWPGRSSENPQQRKNESMEECLECGVEIDDITVLQETGKLLAATPIVDLEEGQLKCDDNDAKQHAKGESEETKRGLSGNDAVLRPPGRVTKKDSQTSNVDKQSNLNTGLVKISTTKLKVSAMCPGMSAAPRRQSATASCGPPVSTIEVRPKKSKRSKSVDSSVQKRSNGKTFASLKAMFERSATTFDSDDFGSLKRCKSDMDATPQNESDPQVEIHRSKSTDCGFAR